MEGGGMSDAELRRMNDEIEGVAQAIFGALDRASITVTDENEWENVEERVKKDMRRLAAVAIDKRDQQFREGAEIPGIQVGATVVIGSAGLRPLRALIDGEGTPEQVEQFTELLDAAITADEATANPTNGRYVVRRLTDNTVIARTDDLAEAVKLADETEGGAHFSDESAAPDQKETT